MPPKRKADSSGSDAKPQKSAAEVKEAILKDKPKVAVRFCVEYAKSGKSSCKHSKCDDKGISAGSIRLGKIVPSPFYDGDMTNWYHMDCLFDSLSKGRADSERISDEDDLEGFYDIKPSDQAKIRKVLEKNQAKSMAFENPEDSAYTENTHGDSEKFWEIARSGKTTRIRYGEIGTEGFTIVKDHSSASAAEDYYEKSLNTKLNKHGYSVATPGAYKPKKAKTDSAPKSGGGKSGGGKSGGGGEDADDLPVNRFCVEYAKSDRSKCRKCKDMIDKGEVRMGKVTRNPFTDSQHAEMTWWFHLKCLFENLKRGRANKTKVDSVSNVDGFSELKKADQKKVESLIEKEASQQAELQEASENATYLEAHIEPGEKADGSWQNEEHKFYEISVAGKTTLTRYGEIGAPGFSLTKQFGSPAAAIAYADSKIREKMGKGYKHVKGPEFQGEGGAVEEKGKKGKAAAAKKGAAKKGAAKKGAAKKGAAKKGKGKKKDESESEEEEEEEEEEEKEGDKPDFSAMTMPQLKAELKKLGLSTSGRKDDLIARLNEAEGSV